MNKIDENELMLYILIYLYPCTEQPQVSLFQGIILFMCLYALKYMYTKGKILEGLFVIIQTISRVQFFIIMLRVKSKRGKQENQDHFEYTHKMCICWSLIQNTEGHIWYILEFSSKILLKILNLINYVGLPLYPHTLTQYRDLISAK